jgi:hypothetical protein
VFLECLKVKILATNGAFNTAALDHIAQPSDPTGSGVYIKALKNAVRSLNAVHPHAPIGLQDTDNRIACDTMGDCVLQFSRHSHFGPKVVASSLRKLAANWAFWLSLERAVAEFEGLKTNSFHIGRSA